VYNVVPVGLHLNGLAVAHSAFGNQLLLMNSNRMLCCGQKVCWPLAGRTELVLILLAHTWQQEKQHLVSITQNTIVLAASAICAVFAAAVSDVSGWGQAPWA
jgi:hypothetical protein